MYDEYSDLTEFLPAHPKQKEATETIKEKRRELDKKIGSLIGNVPVVKSLGTDINKVRLKIREELEAAEKDKSAEENKYFKIYLQETETITLIELGTNFVFNDSEEYLKEKVYIERYNEFQEKGKDLDSCNQLDRCTQTLTGFAFDKCINTDDVTFKDKCIQATVWDIEDSYKIIDKSEEQYDRERGFLERAQIVERVLASNNYHHEQMLFCTDIVPSRGACKYTLTILWSFKDISKLPVTDLCWHTKTQKILAASYGDRDSDEGAVCIWNIKNPHNPERRVKTESMVTSVAVANTRPEIVAYSCIDGSLSLIDITTHKPKPIDLQKRQLGNWPLLGITWFIFEEIGLVSERLMTCGEMGQIYLWDINSRTSKKFEELNFIPTPNKYNDYKNVDKNFPFMELYLPCYFITQHPIDMRTYYVGTFTGAIATCKTLKLCGKRKLWKAHNGVVLGMKFSPFTHLVFLTYGLDGYLNIWVDGIDEPVYQISHLPYYVIGGEWSPTHSTILFTLTQEELKVWNLIKSDRKFNACTKYERFTCMKVSKNGTIVAAGCEDGNIFIYKLNDLPTSPLRPVGALYKVLKQHARHDKDLVKEIKRILIGEKPEEDLEKKIKEDCEEIKSFLNKSTET